MVHLRPFSWSDLDNLLALHNAGVVPGSSQGQATRESLAAHWRQGSVQARRDLWVAETDGEIVAYGGLQPWHSAGWLQVEIVVHPAWRGRGLGRDLLAHLAALAEAAGTIYLCAIVDDEAAESRRFLLQHGFQAFLPRQHMRLYPIVRPEARPVEGYQVRLAGDEDCAALARVNNAAYEVGELAGRADAAGYRRFIRESGTRVWVAQERTTGQVAGLCEVRRRETVLDGARTPTGHIGSLAVLPTAQRRGLGRWLLAGGIDLCLQSGWPSVELNVDRNNAPALHLYESTGFQAVYAFTVYRRRLHS